MSETQAEIEAHNAREMWREVSARLEVAVEEIHNAQCALEDLREKDLADELEMHRLALVQRIVRVQQAHPESAS